MPKLSIAGGSMIPATSIGAQAGDANMTGRPNFLPDTMIAIHDPQFSIPTTTITGKITKVYEKENPIRIIINKKTVIHQNRSQYERIKKNIKPNCNVRVTFQRLPFDSSLNLSQVDNIEFI